MDITQQFSERKQRYKLILDRLQDINVETNFTVEQLLDLQESIKKNDEIHQEGCTALEELLNNNTEVLMDVQVLKSFHEIVSKIFQSSSEFNEKVYANALQSLIHHDDDISWDKIAEIAVNVSCTTYAKSSMFVSMDIEPKERVVRERQKRQKSAPTVEKQPQTINKLKRNDRGVEKLNAILTQVNSIFKDNNNEPIPYYKLIIDPNNFMNTIQNAFQLAFLARDGNIAIETGSDGYPQVRYVQKDAFTSNETTSQSICSLDMDYCDKMIRFYGLKQAMLQIPADENDSNEDDQTDDEDDNQ